MLAFQEPDPQALIFESREHFVCLSEMPESHPIACHLEGAAPAWPGAQASTVWRHGAAAHSPRGRVPQCRLPFHAVILTAAVARNADVRSCAAARADSSGHDPSMWCEVLKSGFGMPPNIKAPPKPDPIPTP